MLAKINKNAFHPIVATALLLSVSVVAAVSFQGWYSQYSDNIFIELEKDTNPKSDLEIEMLVGNTLYVDLGDGVEIRELKVADNDCEINGYYSGIKSFDVYECIQDLAKTTSEVVLITNRTVISKNIFISDISKEEISEPTLSGICDDLDYGEWVEVPGNSTLGTNNFCVMKWEAKAYNISSGEYIELGVTQGGNWADIGEIQPHSVAQARPFVNMTWIKNKDFCEALGEGFKLINDSQWLTITYNVIQQDNNWDSGTVGEGSLIRGNSDGSSRLNGSDPLSGNQRRTFYLSTGEVIWDLAGNTWNRVDKTMLEEERYGGGNSNWMEYYVDLNESDMPEEELPPNQWNHEQGMGKYYDGWGGSDGTYNNVDEEDCSPDDCSDIAVYTRGGNTISDNAGIFALGLDRGPANSATGHGFRCSYSQ